MANGANKSGRPSKSGSKAFTEVFRKLVGEVTQQEAAEKIGVTRQNVGRWLAGMNTPDIEALEKIADAYDVTTDYLLGRTKVKTTDPNLREFCDYTGLSLKSVEFLHEQTETRTDLHVKAFNTLFESEESDNFVNQLTAYIFFNFNDASVVMCGKDKDGKQIKPTEDKINRARASMPDMALSEIFSFIKALRVNESKQVPSRYYFLFDFSEDNEHQPKGETTHADHNPPEE